MSKPFIAIVHVALASLLWSCSSQPGPNASGYAYVRHYADGESFGYLLRNRRELVVAGAKTLTDIEARTAQRVFLKDDVPHERVTWLKVHELPDGEGRDVSGIPASTVSLAPSATFDMVKPADDPAMLGMVTDLVTFYTAIGPKSGIARLSRPGDIASGQRVQGDWSDGSLFPFGKDILHVEIEMTQLDAETAEYETRFRPPEDASLAAPQDFMTSPVCDGKPNNWMMIRRQGPAFIAAWGCESFTVRTRIERSSGRIMSATMSNDVLRDMVLCTDEALRACKPLPQYNEHRDLTLSLAQ